MTQTVPTGTQPDGGCSPDYEGACVPDNGYDVDCGEIPETDFDSVGSDPYGLDRDGDGIACEARTAVIVVRGGRELTEELTKLIRAIRELAREVKGLKGAAVDVEGVLIPIDQADPTRLAVATLV